MCERETEREEVGPGVREGGRTINASIFFFLVKWGRVVIFNPVYPSSKFHA